MISLVVEPYCQECGEFKAYAEKINIQTIGDAVRGEERFLTTVFCEHRNRCNKIYDNMKAKEDSKCD